MYTYTLFVLMIHACMHDQAFVNAWNKACSSSGAVNLLLPEGKTYFLKSIRLNGPCKSILTVQVKYIVDYLYYIYDHTYGFEYIN